MTKQEKLDAITIAYTTKKVHEDSEPITIINEALTEEAHEAIKHIQFELNEITGTFELDYSIMSDACDLVSDLTLEQIESKEVDTYELSIDSASVYTADRLSYLNIHNHAEISELVTGDNPDIATACAIWYEQKVAEACSLLINWLIVK